MKTTIISGKNHRYLSELPEFKDFLPSGIINKKLTDVGGTYCAINCKSSYIVVVPFKDLAKSIKLDSNNKYPVFSLFGGITKTEFKNYLANNEIHKI